MTGYNNGPLEEDKFDAQNIRKSLADDSVDESDSVSISASVDPNMVPENQTSNSIIAKFQLSYPNLYNSSIKKAITSEKSH